MNKTIVPTNLFTNSLLFIFRLFKETKNKNQIFSKLVVTRSSFVFGLE